ncbi:hypothetical protein LAZ67_20001316 [Cordylochernes scorpioides]|uniref:Mos1 transposase HTH domain-containing protein n=1 Tax=Cordylochernes scorpioides TaxID=51811 RepID=A0ABY6LJU7_9ARAC|nr:hypothetical protein LAZ67_20001316 [Cordylochernes scorpioides]
MEQKLKQRICIEFCVKLQISATETFEMINKAFPNDAPKRKTVFEWHSRFKAEFPSKMILVKDAQNFKGLMKIFLTNEQKLCRLATCEDMLEIKRTDPKWKDKIITGDETWVYGNDPETKRQSAEWRGQGVFVLPLWKTLTIRPRLRHQSQSPIQSYPSNHTIRQDSTVTPQHSHSESTGIRHMQNI